MAKIYKLDYASCSIEFVNNVTKVWIKGKSKYNGLRVFEGDKSRSEVTMD